MPKLFRALQWLTAVSTLLILALLAWLCIDIYLDGIQPAPSDASVSVLSSAFRMDDVAARLSSFSVPFIGYAALVILTIAMHAGYHRPTADTIQISAENLLRLRKAHIAVLPDAAKSEESFRRRVRTITGTIITACSIPGLVYLLDKSHFISWDLETVLGDLLIHVVPGGIISFAAAIAESMLNVRSINRELAFLRTIPASVHQEKGAAEKGSITPIIRIALCVLAVLFIVLGVMNGGWYDVLVKAINICTECIGLG